MVNQKKEKRRIIQRKHFEIPFISSREENWSKHRTLDSGRFPLLRSLFEN